MLETIYYPTCNKYMLSTKHCHKQCQMLGTVEEHRGNPTGQGNRIISKVGYCVQLRGQGPFSCEGQKASWEQGGSVGQEPHRQEGYDVGTGIEGNTKKDEGSGNLFVENDGGGELYGDFKQIKGASMKTLITIQIQSSKTLKKS